MEIRAVAFYLSPVIVEEIRPNPCEDRPDWGVTPLPATLSSTIHNVNPNLSPQLKPPYEIILILKYLRHFCIKSMCYDPLVNWRDWGGLVRIPAVSFRRPFCHKTYVTQDYGLSPSYWRLLEKARMEAPSMICRDKHKIQLNGELCLECQTARRAGS